MPRFADFGQRPIPKQRKAPKESLEEFVPRVKGEMAYWEGQKQMGAYSQRRREQVNKKLGRFRYRGEG